MKPKILKFDHIFLFFFNVIFTFLTIYQIRTALRIFSQVHVFLT